MAAGHCDLCGREEYMPFVCKFCKGKFCAEHRLPENHACRGLDVYKERVRTEGRWIAPEPVVTPRMSAGARANALFARVEGKMSYVFLGTFLAFFLVAFILHALGFDAAIDTLFLLDRNVLSKPWTIVTSVFSHIEFNHLFLNSIAFFFFGPTLERLIGSRRFTFLFIGAGAVAGLVQLGVFAFWLPSSGMLNPALADAFANEKILGASGAIMAIFGTLTVLAPRLTVLIFFVIPTPLWLITVLYALLDVVGVLQPGDNVAHLAHLAGLAVGLAFGKRLADQGLRVRVQPQQPNPAFRRF